MISIVSAVIGYVAGAFTPSIGRKIKSLFVESTAAKTAATSAVVGVAGSAVTAVVSKL